MRIRKFERFFIAWTRKKEAEERNEAYDPLLDEELFLQQRDFDMYYQDLAAISRDEENHSKVRKFPFYEEACKVISDENEWRKQKSGIGDIEYRWKNTLENWMPANGSSCGVKFRSLI